MTEIDTAAHATLRQEDQTLSALAVFGAIWTYRWIVAACVAVALIIGIIFLDNATYRYTVMFRIAPTSLDNSGLLNRIGGLAAVAGLSLPTDKTASPFDLYLEAINSSDTAATLARDPIIMREVFSDQWDAEEHRWHPPTSGLYSISRNVKSAIGLPFLLWHPPGGPELADYIERKLILIRDGKKSIVTLELVHKNPVFAAQFLLKLHQTIDASLRARAIARSTEYIDYLNRRLAVTVISENRQALAAALGTEERNLMLASAHRSYAADPFGGPAVSLQPTDPKIGVVLGLSAVVGFSVGSVVAILRRRLRRI